MGAIYDTIGVDYAAKRQPDPRIECVIRDALGSAETVLNVGAGTGSYEPMDRVVTAVEPSAEMIRQRSPNLTRAIQASAEDLPFDDASFDAAMAVLTIHHWTGKEKGLSEMRRVSRGPIVLLTFDPRMHQSFWLADYIPAIATIDDGVMPEMEDFEAWLGAVSITPVPIPHDCTDNFFAANWRRPEAYLDPAVRAATSVFHALGDVSAALRRLEQDLASGAWADRYSDLLELDEHDVGYRLVTTST